MMFKFLKRLFNFLFSIFIKKSKVKHTNVAKSVVLLKTSNLGLNLIRKFEGLRLEAYLDAVDKPTIGYGHTRTARLGKKIDIKQAEDLLREDIEIHNREIKRLVKIPLKQYQFDALSSLVFNIGGANFAKSTMLVYVNDSDFEAAAKEFDRWIFAGGNKLKGLVRRRAEERKLFEGIL